MARRFPSPNLPVLKECLRAGLLCNDAQLARQDGRLAVQGDPTEGALMVAAQKAGLDESRTQRRASASGRHPV